MIFRFRYGVKSVDKPMSISLRKKPTCYQCQFSFSSACSFHQPNHQNSSNFTRTLSIEGLMHPLIAKRVYHRNHPPKNQSNKHLFSTSSKDSSLGAVLDQDNDHERHYSTKTPYPVPSESVSLSVPPAGYQPLCVQMLARHGSRTMTAHDYDQQILKIWHIAQQINMLTSFGEQLKTDVEQFIQANNHIGRGELTTVGREEHQALGFRMYHRLSALFHQRPIIHLMTSGKKRAMDSATEFLFGLAQSNDSMEIFEEKPNKKLLYFHRTCPNYLAFKHNNTQVRQKLESIKKLDQTRFYARQVLKRIFKEDFVELLIQGRYQNEPSENHRPIDPLNPKNEVDLVICLYSMFSISPAHHPSHLSKLLIKYFNCEESFWFGYINDSQEFYMKGPSINGLTVTSDMAQPLLADFFSSINSCREETNLIGATLRFAHAETLIPFASLLQIPGLTDRTVDPVDLYTYEKNPWRGSRVAPMGSNIQWEVYRHETDSQRLLVRMLYNEIEVRFKDGCSSINNHPFFYDFNELKRAYGTLLR